MMYYLVRHGATGATITIVVAPGPEYTDKYTEKEYQKEYYTNSIGTWSTIVPVRIVVGAIVWVSMYMVVRVRMT